MAATNNPQTVNQFRYGGCQGSSDGFAGFRQVEAEPTLTIPQCISDCYDSAYAGIGGDICYCADDPIVATYFITYPDSDCETPCAGNPSQSCGGTIDGNTKEKRQAGSLLTIYTNGDIVPLNGAVSSSNPSSALTSTSASSNVIVGPGGISSQGQIVIGTTSSLSIILSSGTLSSTSTTSVLSGATVILGAGVGSLSAARTSSPAMTASISITLQPTAISTTFVNVCDICEHGMTTATTIITMMHCGCTESVNDIGSTIHVPPPSVPMTTTVKTCNCGIEKAPSTTEVTVPCTSQIEEMSSSMASMLVTAAPGVPAPAQDPSAQAIGEGNGSPAGGAAPAEGNNPEAGNSAPESSEGGEIASGNTPGEAGSSPNEGNNAGEGVTEARTAEVPEMTNSIAPEVGLPAGNNESIHYATTQTIHLQSTETSNATNSSMHVGAPHPASESRLEASPTKKSEGAAGVKRLAGFVAGTMSFVMAFMTVL